MHYEYGIHWKGLDNLSENEQHRNNMTLEQAQEWVDVWNEMGAKPGVIAIVRRPIGDWEIIDE